MHSKLRFQTYLHIKPYKSYCFPYIIWICNIIEKKHIYFSSWKCIVFLLPHPWSPIDWLSLHLPLRFVSLHDGKMKRQHIYSTMFEGWKMLKMLFLKLQPQQVPFSFNPLARDSARDVKSQARTRCDHVLRRHAKLGLKSRWRQGPIGGKWWQNCSAGEWNTHTQIYIYIYTYVYI